MILLLLFNFMPFFIFMPQPSSPKLIQIPLSESVFPLQTVTLYSGESSYPHIITLDINSSYTWVYSPNNSTKDNKIIQRNITFFFREYNLSGQEVRKSIHFIKNNNDQVIDMTFYEILSPIHKSNGALGLAYAFKDYNYSLIHQFLNKGYIDHASFSIIKDSNIKMFYLGGIPGEYTVGRTHSYCDIIDNKDNWNCFLSRIIIKNDTSEYVKNINSNFYLNSNEWYSYTSGYFLDFMIDVYFRKEIDNNRCFLAINTLERFIICDYTPDYPWGNMIFVIGDYSYTIPIKDLWLCGGEQCRFTIGENLYDDIFILGQSFLNKYNILYDYEKKQVHFYSFEGITHLRPRSINNNLIQLILIGIIIILIIGIMIMIIAINKITHHESRLN